MWTTVNFGKWRNKRKTLPQIVVSDPDWFFGAIENDMFTGILWSEANKLARRARAIKLPRRLARTHCVQCIFTPERELLDCCVIPINQPRRRHSGCESRTSTLDLAVTLRNGDLRGARL